MLSLPLRGSAIVVVVFALVLPSCSAHSCSGALDLAVVIDSSGSLRDINPVDGSYDNWNLTLNFVSVLVSRLSGGYGETLVSVVTFSDDAKVEFTLGRYQDPRELFSAITSLRYSGGGNNRNTASALSVVRNRVFNSAEDRPEVPNAVLLLTDGQSTMSTRETVLKAEQLRADGVTVFVVGITAAVNRTEVKLMSSEPQTEGANYFLVADFRALDSQAQRVQTAVCREAVQVSDKGISHSAVDLVFVVDSSGSIRDKNPADKSYDNWRLLLEYLVSLVRQIKIGPGESRVGMVMYSHVAYSVFDLDKYTNLDDVVDAIMRLDFLGSMTNTADGIETMTRMFSAEHGDRQGVANVALLLTDGVSNVRPAETARVALQAREQGVRLVAVGITESVDEQEIKEISSAPQLLGKTYFKSNSFQTLSKDTKGVLDSLFFAKTSPVVVCSEEPVDVVVVVDVLNSIIHGALAHQREHWMEMLDFVARLGRRVLKCSQRFGVMVVAGGRTYDPIFLDDQNSEIGIEEAVMALPLFALSSGELSVRTQLFSKSFGRRSGAQMKIITIVDAESHYGQLEQFYSTLENTDRFVVAVSPNVNRDGMARLVSQPFDERVNFWMMGDYIADESVLAELSGIVLTEASFTTTTTPVPTPVLSCQSAYMDLVFVLDSSGSIRDNNPKDGSYDNWTLLLEFVTAIVESLPIGPKATRVGVVLYSEEVINSFYLNTYDDLVSLVAAIKRLPYLGSFTYTAAALADMHHIQFTAAAGDRPDAPNYAVVITDGESNIEPDRTVKEAILARESDIRILGVGITEAVNLRELEKITSSPHEEGKTYWRSADFNKLGDVVTALVQEACVTKPTIFTDETTVAATSTVKPVIVTGAVGSTGHTGPRGSPGVSGTVGATGASGSNGADGRTGVPGIKGPDGRNGRDGETGSTGSIGRQGETGATGKPGKAGKDGITGSQGQTGAAGLPGDGYPGETGSTGKSGESGITGAPGKDGLPGRAGSPGKAGEDGQLGETGSTGIAGETGATGNPGLPGRTGTPGQDGETGGTGSSGRHGETGLTGISGETGASGAPGRVGETGATGRDGVTGSDGATGARGAAGETGLAGAAGAKGITGIEGLTGATGFPGESGATGAAGKPGHTGSTGEPGSDGLPGKAGTTGATGFNGETGSTGARGPAGEDGRAGVQGLAGKPGKPGIDGTTGATGLNGESGATGERGSDGRPGATGSTGITGQVGGTGESGATGRRGPVGASGVDGRDGQIGSTGKAGQPGQAGPQGATGISVTGETGATGYPGETGATGVRGRGLAGATGQQGPRGADGKNGERGQTGATGENGVNGETGSTGPAGERGSPGLAGSAGIAGTTGATGKAGLHGQTGSTGAAGLDGLTGSTGSTGPRGPFGVPGSDGANGRTGSTGHTGVGETGSTGAQGLPGRRGETGGTGARGADGVTGLDGLDGEIGSVGAPGADGSIGPAGLTGKRGETGSTGSDGAAGRTGATGVSGARGETGAAGKRGKDGADGKTGASGVSGVDGLTGATGLAGRPGALGEEGARGRPGLSGAQGKPGVTGATGSAGARGQTGSTGPRGSDGAPGETGSAGRSGSPGNTGATGVRGNDGPRGIDGRDGLVGKPGPKGSAGADGNTGATGVQGAEGNSGSIGFPGPRGQRGEPGNAGLTGATGSAGPNGARGQTGASGADGSDGLTGATGTPGAEGQRGDSGATGPAGRSGESGVAGLTGSTGPAGSDGRTGASGPAGPRGLSGAAGRPGQDGKTGSTGATGPRGIGNTGATGKAGRPGLPGSDGEPGESGVTGLSGADGESGATGATGLRGRTGATGSGNSGATGSAGVVGATGPVGLSGARGVAGRPGAMGATGAPGPDGESYRVDECKDKNHGCEQTCVDTYDSAYCACRPGYEIVPTSIDCPGAVPCQNAVIDLVFVIDSSGSIRDNNPEDESYDNWQLLLEFTAKMVSDLPVNPAQTRIGAVKFSNKGESIFFLNTFSDSGSVQKALLETSYVGGNTNTSGGLREMIVNQFIRKKGDRPEARNIAIVITDGRSTFDAHRTVSDAEAARALGIEIYSVGITSGVDETELKEISSLPQEKEVNWFTSTSFTELNSVEKLIVKDTCKQEVTDFTLFCKETYLGGRQCFCRRSDSDIRSVNGTTCTDLDECAHRNGGCQQRCENTEGSYRCHCAQGLTLADNRHDCNDINECLVSPCEEGLLCTNTYGGYYCLDAKEGDSSINKPQVAALKGQKKSLETFVSWSTVLVACVSSAVLAVVAVLVIFLGIRLLGRKNEDVTKL